jgi:hypothetical protein
MNKPSVSTLNSFIAVKECHVDAHDHAFLKKWLPFVQWTTDRQGLE